MMLLCRHRSLPSMEMATPTSLRMEMNSGLVNSLPGPC